MSKLALYIGIAVTVTFTHFASAGTIFSCDTSNNKKIEVQDLNHHIEYRFGRNLESPELTLSVIRDQASTWQWQGVGRHMNYSVTMPNGNTNYTVFFSVDRGSDEYPVTSGVIIEVNNKVIATVDCISDTLIQLLEGINLKATN
ncbi:hypothetical protein L4C36_22335 [Photobacterium japonica]|uniref:hypothetical protein n=1 Tax=Photobacterium japonica TaxID=2910235 RepID=UPI003D0F6CA4